MNAVRKWKEVPHHPNVYRYETRRGTRYGIRRVYTDSEGKRREFTRSGKMSWRDAESILKKFEDDYVNGNLKTLSNAATTLGNYFDKLSARKLKYKAWRQSTYDAHVRYFNNHIRPVFGNKRMQEITRAQYQAFIDHLDDEKHMGVTTIRSIHRIMMETVNAAVTEDVLDKNRLKRVEIHGHQAKPVDLSREDFERWITTAEKILNKYDYALIKAATLGMRRGEILGLRVSSIKFARDQVNNTEIAAIKIDMQRGVDYPTGGPLKTSTSNRTIWASGDVVDLLHYAILASKNIRKRNCAPATATQWLWVNRYGNAASYAYLVERMSAVNDATGLKIRPHMLRHYFATQAIAANTPQAEVMHYLGHKNMQMTFDYTRATEQSSLKVFKNFTETISKETDKGNDKESAN